MSTILNETIASVEVSASFSLTAMILWAIKYYSEYSISPILIGQYSQTIEAELEHKDLIEAVLKNMSTTVNIKYSLQSNYYDLIEHDEDYSYDWFRREDKAIWFIDGLTSFNHLKADMLSEREIYERNGFFCIVYTGQEPNRMEVIEWIFQRFYEIYVIHINIFLLEEETTFIYTFLPFVYKKCYYPTRTLVGSLGPSTNFTFIGKAFFLRKLSNLWGCNMTITTWNEPPYVIIDENKQIRGIEGLLLMELSRFINFSIVIKTPPENDRGVLYPNNTATGAMKMLMNSETNITIMCLMYDKTRLKVADAAYTYYSAPIVVGLPKGRLMTPFERLLRPFRRIVWCCLSSSVIGGILFIYILKCFSKHFVQSFVFGERNRRPFTNLWSVLYGVSLSGSMPRRNFARYLLALWIFYTWILRTAYVGELFILLQDSRARSSLKTLEEVFNKNYTFFTYPLLERVLTDVAKQPIKWGNIGTDQNSLSNLFKRISREETDFVVTCLGGFMLEFNQRHENRMHQIRILPEPVFQAPITFYMPKHSYLVYGINRMLVNMMSSGFLSRFEALSLDTNWKRRTQEPTALSLWLLFGIFSTYLILLVFCTLVFLCELLSTRSKFVKKIMDFVDF